MRSDRRFIASACVALVALALVALQSVALAQDGTHPRRTNDPPVLTPPEQDGNSWVWQIVTIPGIASGTSLGALWTGSSGDLYVWGFRQGIATRAYATNVVPTGPVSSLYHWDGSAWAVALELTGVVGGTVFGTSERDVFASAVGTDRSVKMYHYDGARWKTMKLPDGVVGPAGALVGRPNEVYFRSADAVLGYDGKHWTRLFSDPSLLTGQGLAYASKGEIYARCDLGHWLWNARQWSWFSTNGPSDVKGAWGTRDGSGNLQFFATGCEKDMNCVHIWKFVEDTPGNTTGNWTTSFCSSDEPGEARLANTADLIPRRTGGDDPPPGPVVASGVDLWGVAGGAVYAVATLNGNGLIYRFDGQTWKKIDVPGPPIPPVVDIWGTGSEGFWVTLADGRFLRSTASGRSPDCSAAYADMPALWPRNHKLVPIHILGVTDPDGDAVTITATGVTQDERIYDPGDRCSCPDAVIEDGLASVRAECENNGNGRVYAISFTAEDGHGGTCDGIVKVCVPRVMDGTCIDDGQSVNSLGPCRRAEMAEQDATLGDLSIRVVESTVGKVAVEYSLARQGEVLLIVYDIAGRHLATLENGNREAGAHRAVWDTKGLAPGTYFCRLRAGGKMVTHSLFVLR